MVWVHRGFGSAKRAKELKILARSVGASDRSGCRLRLSYPLEGIKPASGEQTSLQLGFSQKVLCLTHLLTSLLRLFFVLAQ